MGAMMTLFRSRAPKRTLIRATTILTVGAIACATAPVATAVPGADLVTGGVSGGRFVPGQLRPDASVIVWRNTTPYALLDIRALDSARDGNNAVVTCFGKIGAGDYLKIASASSSGYNTQAVIYQNAYFNANLPPSYIKCRLTVGSQSVEDVNKRGGQ